MNEDFEKANLYRVRAFMNIAALKEKPYYLTDDEMWWVRETLEKMTLPEKAGQLFIVLGDVYSQEELKELVVKYNVSGVLFRPDTQTEIKRKLDDADALAKIPLLRAANIEDGGSGIITDGTCFGNQLQIAAADDTSMTENFAVVCAAEAQRAGANWTFSPVVDIDMNYRNPITNMRTFGSDPDKVRRHASVFVKTVQRYGIAASCKHFPGDGVDFRDPHLHPTYNDLSAEEWYSTSGKIYKDLIDDGLMTIMAGHIIQPNVIKDINPDADAGRMLPGSQSEEMLQGILRKKYGFNGLIISDATIMGGYTMTMKRHEAIPLSIASGCDMLCFGTDIKEDISYIVDAIEDGRLSEERLDEAIMRILALKAVLRRVYPAAVVDAETGKRACAEAAVTLVKDTQRLIPVDRNRYPDIRLVTLGEDTCYDGSVMDIAASWLGSRGFRVERYEPMKDDLHGSGRLPEDRLTIIIANYPAASNQTEVRIHWCEKHAIEQPRFLNEEKIVFIGLSNPYHLQDIPRVKTFINAYSATDASIESALAALIGETDFRGKSPVDAFCGLPDTRL